jgi:tryptophanyl-tRNA synthetase
MGFRQIAYDSRMTRVLSGITPSSTPTLGNYLGALRRWAESQHDAENFFFVADMHALTTEHDPAQLRERSITLANTLLAVGIDPHVSTVFVQSHVPAHAQLGWLIECTARFGELRRMTQFKDKGGDNEGVRAGLFTYPCLMAADILLYDIEQVPVGEDQRQHVELTRDVAIRFNSSYGDTFTVPEATMPPAAARVKDLQEPTKKMSKSSDGQGTVFLMEDLSSIAKKIKRAVTDNDAEVRYDPVEKPGVSNLLEILGACIDESPTDLAGRYTQYGPLKSDTADAVVEMLQPIQERYFELVDDPATTLGTLAAGAEHAREIADRTLRRAQERIGFLVPGK